MAIDSRDKEVQEKQLEELLTDYTRPTLEQSVLDMLTNELGVDAGLLRIEQLPDHKYEPPLYFDDPVFKVYDEKGKFLWIVKGFRYYQWFLGQLSAQEKIYALDLPHVTTTAPIACGRADSHGIPFWLLVQTVAKGTQLSDLALSVQLDLLQAALKKLANCLAELHLSLPL